jgi:hypothetical protein
VPCSPVSARLGSSSLFWLGSIANEVSRGWWCDCPSPNWDRRAGDPHSLTISARRYEQGAGRSLAAAVSLIIGRTSPSFRRPARTHRPVIVLFFFPGYRCRVRENSKEIRREISCGLPLARCCGLHPSTAIGLSCAVDYRGTGNPARYRTIQ